MAADLSMRRYRIAGLRILAEAANVTFTEGEGILTGYTDDGPEWDHRLSLRMADALPSPQGECIHLAPDRRVFRDGDRRSMYLGPVGQDLANANVLLSREGKRSEVCFLRNPLGLIRPRELLDAMDLPHLLTVHDGFLLHASFIEHGGKAILFTAPSETGKSTQAQLWCEHMGAELVNGDRAAVRIVDGEVYACGIPFSGSSPVRRNVTLPLKAIVYLSQAPENAIQRLRGVRAFRRVWEGCTVNVWDREDVELATKTVGDVVSCVPIYHLACTPDVRAAELLNQTMEVEK